MSGAHLAISGFLRRGVRGARSSQEGRRDHQGRLWLNHYPHHLGDYAKDTLGLSMLEHGAYRLLLDAYYANEAAPAVDEVYAIARAGTPAERRAVEKVLKKFELRDGRYYHKRVEAELVAYRGRSQVAAEKARIRWEKEAARVMLEHSRSNAQTDAAALPGQCPADAGAMLASNHKPITKPLRVVSDTFGRFWKAWPNSPRKVAKAKCRQVWERRELDALADQILAHLEALKPSEQWRKGFEPAPLTYLSQNRWEDGEAPPSDPRLEYVR